MLFINYYSQEIKSKDLLHKTINLSKIITF